MNLEKFFFICPKFLQNGFFSPGWRLVLPAARPWFWPRPGSPVFRADSGRPISVLAQGRRVRFSGLIPVADSGPKEASFFPEITAVNLASTDPK